MLFVPGGWASNKLKALGEKGIEEIKRFIHEGGNYFGICGGAGLATMDGLGLLNINRKPTKQRVPSFSGRISLNINEHPIWNKANHSLPITHHPSQIFHAWWPSQFVVNAMDIKILATFQEALPDSYSSDLNVGDIRKNRNWKELEELYGINLDPERLKDEPAVVEGRFGKGRVLLSLIHFDTPQDENGAEVLTNIWEYLAGQGNRASIKSSRAAAKYDKLFLNNNHSSTSLLRYCSEIIEFGIRNFLWFWRTPMLLQWRRGVRGLEYCTLYIMAKELASLEEDLSRKIPDYKVDIAIDLLNDFFNFKEKVLRLLMLEREAMQRGMITYEYSDSPEILALRKELFGDNKSYGGKFKGFLDQIDSIIYQSLILQEKIIKEDSGAPERI